MLFQNLVNRFYGFYLSIFIIYLKDKVKKRKDCNFARVKLSISMELTEVRLNIHLLYHLL